MEVLKLETWINEFGEDQLNLDKLQEYLDFIIEARDHYDPERYSEWHHVMPKCIDNEKKFRDQGVRINGADHFRAHMKLVECFSGEKKSRLSYALMRMKNNVTSHGESITPEDWEIAVKMYAHANSLRSSKRVGPLNANYGRRYKLNLSDDQRSRKSKLLIGNNYGSMISEETRKKKSERFSGENNPFYGKSHSKETKRVLSEGRQGSLNPCYGKIWITNGEVCKRINPEELDSYLSKGYYKGRIVSEETRRAHSQSQENRSRDSRGRWI